MEPTSTGQQLSVSSPMQAATTGTPGSWDWSTPHPILRLRSCKALFPSALPTPDDVCDQRLLVFSSFEPSSWTPGNNFHLSILLPGIRHWLCLHPNMATVVCLSPLTWHWHGHKGIHNPSICRRELARFHQRKFGHGMAIMGRLRNFPVRLRAKCWVAPLLTRF